MDLLTQDNRTLEEQLEELRLGRCKVGTGTTGSTGTASLSVVNPDPAGSGSEIICFDSYSGKNEEEKIYKFTYFALIVCFLKIQYSGMFLKRYMVDTGTG